MHKPRRPGFPGTRGSPSINDATRDCFLDHPNANYTNCKIAALQMLSQVQLRTNPAHLRLIAAGDGLPSRDGFEWRLSKDRRQPWKNALLRRQSPDRELRNHLDKPVYLLVEDKSGFFKEAGHPWRLDAFEIQKALTGSHPKVAVLAIGPAGENLCRIAIRLNRTASAAGQGGYGAVMCPKNLKAIVVRGDRFAQNGNPGKFLNLVAARHAAGERLKGGAQSWDTYPLCGEAISGKMRVGRNGFGIFPRTLLWTFQGSLEGR